MRQGNNLPAVLSQVPARPATDSLGDPLPAAARLRLGTLRFRPPSPVYELALSPDGAAIVTVGADLIVWDAASGKERWRARGKEFSYDPPGASYGMRVVAFSSDSSRFYTPGKPNEIAIWEISSGRHEVVTVTSTKEIARPKPSTDPPGPRSIDIARDGQKLALGNADGVVVCDRTGKVLYEIANAGERPVKDDPNDRLGYWGQYSLARFSPDGKILAVHTSDIPEEVGLYDAESGRNATEGCTWISSGPIRVLTKR